MHRDHGAARRARRLPARSVYLAHLSLQSEADVRRHPEDVPAAAQLILDPFIPFEISCRLFSVLADLSIPSEIGACAIAALKPVRPQKQNPAREEMLKLLPQTRSSCSVKGRQISSRQVDTRLMLVSGVNPCFPSTRVACLMRTASGTARGK